MTDPIDIANRQFPENLSEWTDWDAAMSYLAQALNLVARHEGSIHRKSLYWTDNPVGTALHQMLLELVQAGILLRRDEPDEQFRWNPDFDIEFSGKIDDSVQ